MDNDQITASEDNPQMKAKEDSQETLKIPSSRIQLPQLKALDQNHSNVEKLPEIGSKSLSPFRKAGEKICRSLEKNEKLKEAYGKKHHLLVKLDALRKFKNSSRLASTNQSTHLGQQSPYRAKIQVKENISVQQHSRNINFLQKINSEKIQREKRLLNEFKKRQQEAISPSNTTELEKIYQPLKKSKKTLKNDIKTDQANQNSGESLFKKTEEQGQSINNTTEHYEDLKKQQIAE